ncbi:MAG: hypothetical protein A2677_00140 [Candidatus Komeilibacteria bacterium RIFCSPHIGHO2_01_FULL_52_14]|uniref:DUF559 domain-containing protein n=1 Tax=Candidatus Komeilibacteria bacterium RIFCSPHIGHO2_01_FULL_52_14 TaxID=1798549 RepID=A0A1G2BJ61_9BACT|nr:MAG: hypothetical protein A2677_00140 [Candidatus Komeilibacteria bacterium RIFCSPHIGHO2_01_FULL_52_14]
MTLLFNNPDLKHRRRQLRNNATDAESLLWSRLRGRQLRGFKFRRQFSIGKYIVDFYCPRKKIAIEVDGSQHMEQTAHEDARNKFLQSKNIRVIRFWNTDVLLNIEGVLEEIAKVLDTTPSSSP